MKIQDSRTVGMDAVMSLSKDQLIEMVEILAKKSVSIDETWFQSLERNLGLAVGMNHDFQAENN